MCPLPRFSTKFLDLTPRGRSRLVGPTTAGFEYSLYSVNQFRALRKFDNLAHFLREAPFVRGPAIAHASAYPVVHLWFCCGNLHRGARGWRSNCRPKQDASRHHKFDCAPLSARAALALHSGLLELMRNHVPTSASSRAPNPSQSSATITILPATPAVSKSSCALAI